MHGSLVTLSSRLRSRPGETKVLRHGWIKNNLPITVLFGGSESAIKGRLWSAVSNPGGGDRTKATAVGGFNA